MDIAPLYQPLLLYVRKRVHNRHDAEDLTQDVFLRLSKSNLDRIENVKSWVYTIAKNAITDYYRKRKSPTGELTENTIPETAHEPDEVVQELSRCVTAYINMLPEDYRHLLTLSELESVPQKEIATRLGMNYTTVRSKVQRGRQKLKEIFTACCTVQQGAKGSILGYERNKTALSGNNCGEGC